MNYKTLSLYTIHEIESIQLCAIESVKKNMAINNDWFPHIKTISLVSMLLYVITTFSFSSISHLNNFWHLNIEIT